MDDNRRKVEEGHGRQGGLHLPAGHAVEGYTNFNRYYFAQAKRDGAVIDERFNGGGWVADYIIDWLNRPLLMKAMTRRARTTSALRDLRSQGDAHQRDGGLGRRCAALDVPAPEDRPPGGTRAPGAGSSASGATPT